ncbi:WUSCHEL-related homeobox 13 isoform X1 [Arachis duranensis]|uniref:WUSCHEL-related homeobox 13 isoform X1 n=2 Tax=Arachis duranensis TaxID=130453 RepID=A0A6P4C3J9_ARADU|nr:WUSCHEL-related homeobox 13 isoform X1 [Arachis duranensis]XP_025620919.1 WUSCHEL-related homeobox 13 isoform X1 [Arachis hypogaea]
MFAPFMIEWQKQLQNNEKADRTNNNMVFVKVMTDEQLETLRKQIAVYATLCDQLVEMHRTLSTHHDLAGVRVGNIYCDSLMTSAGQKITSRQRWTPTPLQLQILERIFDQGNGTPSKEKIKEITSELSHHGQISETNVYNWFQNRRARSKRKLQNNVPHTTIEPEVDAEVDSKDKKTRPEELIDSQQQQHSTIMMTNASAANRSEKLCFQNPELQYLNNQHPNKNNKSDPIFTSDGTLRPLRNFSRMPVFDDVLSNSRGDYLDGKMEVGGMYNLYQQGGDYNLGG